MRKLALVFALAAGLSLAAGLQATARAEGATVIRTPEEQCFIETSPGVWQWFTCNNLDVYTPNDKIRTTAHGDFTLPADGTADVYQGYPEGFPVCDATVSASGKTRFTCHLNDI